MYLVRQIIINLHIMTSIFLVPFSGSFWLILAVQTLCFSVEMSVANFESAGIGYHVQIPMYWMMMLFSTYFIKWVLI